MIRPELSKQWAIDLGLTKKDENGDITYDYIPSGFNLRYSYLNNTKIEYRDRLLYDSIYIHDSIFTLIKGDTVYIYKNKETNHLINKVDTFIKTDTIKVPITITKTVTKTKTQIKEVNKLYWWQRLLICLGLTVLIFGVIYIIRKTKNLF